MRIYQIIIHLLIINSITFQAFGQRLPQIKPEDVGLSSKRMNRIQTVLQKYVDDDKLPGLISMVSRKGKLVHLQTYGVMDLETEKSMQPNSIFRIYSMTKPVISVAVMMLYERGYLQLGDPVSKYIPAFVTLTVYEKDPDGMGKIVPLRKTGKKKNMTMTIKHLLTHTSGLTYGYSGNAYIDSLYEKADLFNKNTTLEAFVQKLGGLPLLHHPGEKWYYSLSTDVLGYLIEVVSQTPLDVFLRENIFIPLGMHDTGFQVPENSLDRFVSSYTVMKDGSLVVQDKPQDSPYGRPITFFSGGAGLVSTVIDYMRFSQMLLNKGHLDGIRLLGRKTVEFMTMNHLNDDFMAGLGFGLGFSVVTDVSKLNEINSNGTYGWEGVANTFFFIDPEEELIGLLFNQYFADYKYPVYNEFRAAIYQALID